MLLLDAPVSFCVPMAQKEKTVQLHARIRESVKKRIDRFCILHPMQPALATIIEVMATEYLDREEANLPQKGKK